MIKIKKSKDGQYYFVICSPGNNKVLVTSETYTRKANVLKSANAVADAVFNCWPGGIIDETK